jgi:hypothetical protein
MKRMDPLELIDRIDRARLAILVILADRPDALPILDRLEVELERARARSCLSRGRSVISKASAS